MKFPERTMSKKTRLYAGTLATAVVAAMSAYAASTNTTDAAIPLSRQAAVGGTGAALPAKRTVALPTLPRQTGFDRFIVKYRAAPGARNVQATTVLGTFNTAVARAGLSTMRANGVALSATHVRRLAIGGDVLRTSRALSVAESNALLEQLRSDPSVEYAQPDYRRYKFDFV